MAGLCFATTTLLISGCNKIDWDDLFHHPDKADKFCAIKKITAVWYGDTTIAKFSYNSYGDPVEVALNKMSTGHSGFRFLYDKSRRLTDYLGSYGDNYILNNSYEFWHHYVYQNGRIVRDTLRIFGEYPNYNYYYFLRVLTYEYDNNNRVIKMTDTQLKPDAFPTHFQTFTYNADGNLEKHAYYYSATDNSPSIYTYTYNLSKPNLLRTNKIWMFAGLDYSVNAPVNAVSYNQYGLPLKLNVPEYYFLPGFHIGNSSIEYQCK